MLLSPAMERGTLLFFSAGMLAAYGPLFLGLIALGLKAGLSGVGLESINVGQVGAVGILAGWGIGLHVALWLLFVVSRSWSDKRPSE